ncbi:MAG: CDP-glycerol glycerophosphotransferase family protein [Microbacteriaceae bacterium]|nr:CDP-glycerol glycerophosphotransferase family protein [Microbacteriaceae bacterium]
MNRFTKVLARLKRATRSEYHAFWRSQPVKPNTVLYEAFAGNGMLCNPEAIFRTLLAAADQQHLRHIWVLTDFDRYCETIAEFASDARVSFVKYRSLGYFRALATSGTLINNSTFPPDFGKRPGQTYLNTWHGTPLKHMGYDIPHGGLQTGNILRNFVAADYLLAANSFMTDTMYASAYKLRGIFRGVVVEEGYPRIDRQFLESGEAADARARLTAAGLAIGEREIILYAPTWKGASFHRPLDDVDELLARVAELESLIDTDRYCVLLKTHQVVHEFASLRPELNRVLVPNGLPSNLILGVTAVLVTDYSSIFFDFLPTERPILFLTPDLADYDDSRGLYLVPEDWPGPVCATVPQLADQINQLSNDPPAAWAERYRVAQERFTALDDGRASERIVDIVFRQKREGYRIRQLADDARESVLIHLGGMRPNGITTSALNLLNSIDHTRFDVSALFPLTTRASENPEQQQIHPETRMFPRVGGMNGSKLFQAERHLALRIGATGEHARNRRQDRLWDEEWARCFGASRFDYVIDFSGYSPFWATLLLHSPKAMRSIWLHNDMAADAHRAVGGRRRLLLSLTGVFRLYADFDHLVSVSPALAEINRRKLELYAAPEKFSAALNTVDFVSILTASHELAITPGEPGSARSPISAAAIESVLADPELTVFVTVGRLSPEKNQARLVRAFARIHAENAATRLLLVGDGPLYGDLVQLVAELGLGDVVTLAGLQLNPWGIMVRSSCFVLSSDYEGQPMVILEALVLGLPVVTVDFGSVGNALPLGLGLIVPQSEDGLVEGMQRFLAGTLSTRPFDYTGYNRKAINEFYPAIGAERPADTE